MACQYRKLWESTNDYTCRYIEKNRRWREERSRKRREERVPSEAPPSSTPTMNWRRIIRSLQQNPHQVVWQDPQPTCTTRLDCACFSADLTHSMPIRPIRDILTRAHERAAQQTSERASERAENRSGSRSGTTENKRTEVGVDSRIDVDTLAYQSHSPNGHRRVKSLHLLPLSGLANRKDSRSPSVGLQPMLCERSFK